MTSPHFLFDKPFDLAPVAGGVVVAEISAIEYLNEKNGRLELPVPHVCGEKKVQMVGAVPESWSLL